MQEIILKVGAEGGSITLFGNCADNGMWEFSLHVYDCSDDDEEQKEFHQKPPSASSWPEALNMLKRYPSWHHLYPLSLHPDFEARILDEVRRCGGDTALELWREAASLTRLNMKP